MVTAARRRIEKGDLLTVPQILGLLPVSRSTLYRLIENGQLPCHRVRAAGSRHGRLLVHRADLEAFVAKARETRPRAPTRVDVDALLKRVRRGRG